MRILAALLTALFIFGCANEKKDDGEDPIIQNTSWKKLTKLNTSGNKSFVLKSKTSIDKSYDISGVSIAADTCLGAGAVDSSTYELLGSNTDICYHDFEVLDTNGNIYISYSPTEFVADPSADVPIATDTVPPVYHAIRTPSGTIHHLDKTPAKPTGFSNSQKVRVVGSKILYINNGELIEKDMSTDIEFVKFSGNINRYMIIDRGNGRNYLTVGDKVVMHKPDDSTTDIPELLGKGVFANIDGLQYSDDRAKYASIDDNGNVTLGLRSNPVVFKNWLDCGGCTGIPIELPGVSMNGIKTGDYLISNKIYKTASINTDFSVFDVADFGHAGFDSWANVKACSSNDYLYLYSQHTPESSANPHYRISLIDEYENKWRDILNTHKIESIGCSLDNIILACGTNLLTSEKETIRIELANTLTPSYTYTIGCDSISQAP